MQQKALYNWIIALSLYKETAISELGVETSTDIDVS